MAAVPTASATPEVRSISAEQAKLVLDVSRMLAVTTDLDPLLKRIAEAATELTDCERASIFLHDADTDQLWTKVALQSAEIRVPSSAGIVGAAFKENEVLLIAKPYEDKRFNQEVDRRTGFVTRNILAAPMVDLDRKPLGVIQAINKKSGGFDTSDVQMLQLLADQAGVAIQRYRLQLAALEIVALRHEMDLARKVQNAMLPKHIPQIKGIEAVGWTRPASITGGDTYDFWDSPDGRLGIFLADASGHGLAPTLVVSQVRTLVRAMADLDPNPARLLAKANARLAEDLEPDRFVTAFVGFLSPDGVLEWCSAGHGPILVRRSCDAPLEELTPPEMPLGVMPTLFGELTEPVQLEPTGMLAVVSDGIFEAPNAQRDQFSMERVHEILLEKRLCSPHELIAALRDAVTEWQGGDDEDPKDDQTIVAVRRVAAV
jgi:serine phosphatase RsbU (regulator of sigma subunit)